MFAASSSGGMPPTSGMGSRQIIKERVPSDTQQPQNLQQPRVNAPSSTSQAPDGSLNSFGTATNTTAATNTDTDTDTDTDADTATATAAAAAPACPTAAPPCDSCTPSINQSATTTMTSGPPASPGGDGSINGVTTAFAGMGLPQAGASWNPTPFPPMLPQRKQPQPQPQQRPQQQPQPQQTPQQQQLQQRWQSWQHIWQQQQKLLKQQQLHLRQQTQQIQQQTQRRQQKPQQQQPQQQQPLQQQPQQQQQQQQQQPPQEQEPQQQQPQQQQQQQQQQPQEQEPQQQQPQQQQQQPRQQKQQKQRHVRSQSWSPFRQKPIDLRLQVQASKLAFITSKRSGKLLRAGFTLRRETGHGSIQEFLDKTRVVRKPYGGRGLFGFPPTFGGAGGGSTIGVGTGQDYQGNPGSLNNAGLGDEEDSSDRGGGVGSVRTRSERDLDGDDHDEWRDMTFAYSEAVGWVFLHHATEAGIELVHELVRTIHGHEIGIFSSDERAGDTIAGFASALETCNDVSVVIKGAIVDICGTLPQVENVSKAIEAIASGTTRMYAEASWYWRGDGATAELCPWYSMSSEANIALEAAFTSFKESGSGGHNLRCYKVGGVMYRANFRLMSQINETTGFVRPIRRMVADRQGCPLPRCPKEKMPLSNFREGTNYSLVAVTKEEDAMVRDAVEYTYCEIPILRVEHVWNSFLWGHYAQNAKSVGNENLMFHGAPAEALNQICRTGFDRRLAGSKHGAKFGHGCYFARDANLSAAYMRCLDYGQMILAKVLVGEFTLGDSTMVKPPKMGGTAGDRTYDTTSDCLHSPKLIVTYQDWMAYPMYLITFGRLPLEGN